MNARDTSSDTTPQHGAEAAPDCEAIVVERDDAPDELTVFPTDADESELVTTWMTARKPSFVALGEMR